jgi:hypothetical protein
VGLAGDEIHNLRRRIAHTVGEQHMLRCQVPPGCHYRRRCKYSCTKVSGWLCGHDDVRLPRRCSSSQDNARGQGGKALTLSNSTPTPQGCRLAVQGPMRPCSISLALAADELPSTHGLGVRADASSMFASAESCGGSLWLTG